MSIRSKTIAIISCTVIILIAILYFTLHTIVVGSFEKAQKKMLDGFLQVEQEDTRRNVMRVNDALKAKIENLSIKAADWAQWDDTYRFIVDKNEAYIESNLNEDALIALKINFILMYTAAGAEVFGIGFDLNEESSVLVPQSVKECLKPGSYLLAQTDPEGSLSGVILLPENPLMIVSRPITTSSGEGPVRGTLIFARYLDDAEFANLAEITHLSLRHYLPGNDHLPQDFVAAQSQINKESPLFVNPLNNDTIAGYTIINDMQQKPSILVRVDIPRDIFRQGNSTLDEIEKQSSLTLISLVVSTSVTGLILAVVILIMLEISVLSRLSKLSDKAVAIGTTGDFTARINEDGRDEIKSLAHSVNIMLQALSASHQTIQAQHAEMSLLMNTVPAGLIALDEKFVAKPEYSRSAGEILGTKEIAGRPFAAILGLTGEREPDGIKLNEFLDVLRQELLPEKEMAGLNPFEQLKFKTETGIRWLSLQYFIIRREAGQQHHILAIIEDITEEKKLAEEVARSQRENLQLKAIAEDPDLFREFLVETRNIIKTVTETSHSLQPSRECTGAINEMFRGVHTIKGVAGSFGLFQLVETAGNTETMLSPLRKESAVTAECINQAKELITSLNRVFEAVVLDASKILGDDIGKGSSATIRIPVDELKKHITDIRNMQVDEALKDRMILQIKEEIIGRLVSLKSVPLKKGIARSLKIIPDLIKRLGKNIEFRFEGQDTAVDYETALELNTPMIHLIRNAMDHGIETPEERLETGKSEQGVIALCAQRQNGHFILHISDDGRGIDPDKVKKSALKKGVISQKEFDSFSKVQCYELIFRPGFSTADTITEVSGRGVGMDAVLNSIKNKLHGTIEIDSDIGKGTRFSITIPS